MKFPIPKGGELIVTVAICAVVAAVVVWASNNVGFVEDAIG
ncbi:hypothetical protein P8629_06990 [Hydrogenovibrio sp. 3SP14C1]|nr:hypothetical protein [Hydrogenovibrio sp. 3SP14C1]MDG4812751.1 hypothetical protein [Hydrogenovibrio sp. 3SP14C1]